MSCPHCGCERGSGKFCAECGRPLAQSCSRCQGPLTPGAKFCPECGTPTGDPRRPLRSGERDDGERRQITVVFCDLVGSTELSARLDPEEWRDLVRAYQEATATVVERHDGYIAQYLGDGVLVYFGYPHAHENAAERAVRAGLGMVEAVRDISAHLTADRQLAVRVGIHTGSVVVSQLGGGARQETLAVGKATNLAARLQGLALPNIVVMSASTQRLVPGLFVVQELAVQELKGIAQPVACYRPLRPSGVRSRLDIAAGRLTRFVGRDVELGALLGHWKRVADGHCERVLLVGEAGVGKSRL